MKILIIGNGFDLAHELPTKYTDFLEFISKVESFKRLAFKDVNEYNEDLHKNQKLNEFVKSYIKSAFSKKDNPDKILQELFDLSKDNYWIECFRNMKGYQNEGWINFESEISNAIQNFEEFCRLDKKTNLSKVNNETQKIIGLAKRFIDKEKVLNMAGDVDCYIYEKRLLGDLNQLIRCLEIYLEDCLGKFKIEYVSPDIMDINFDKILSFNYTDTYKKVYEPYRKANEYDFIHGKANILNAIETNNMVLGIDEYLDDELRDKDTTFIEFKKYYQRIHKKTGCSYKDWITEIKKATSEKHEIYIFGHSLDVTDKDVIRELIDNENVRTTIFYSNKKAYGNQIANLVKVLGQDNLIAKVYGADKRITFKEQKPMIPLKETELEIRADIYNLYNLYNLSDQEAHALIGKVEDNIRSKNIEYFKTQYNVISLYDALILLEEIIDLEFELLTIAGEVGEISHDCRLEYDFNSWKNYDYAGEHDCNIKTMKFINCLNKNNREKFTMMNHQKMVNTINLGDINSLCKLLINYDIKDIDILSKMMNMLFAKFNESGVIIKKIWECIYKVLDRTAEDIIEEYIINKKNNTKDLVLKTRLLHIEEVLAERNYYHRLHAEFSGENE